MVPALLMTCMSCQLPLLRKHSLISKSRIRCGMARPATAPELSTTASRRRLLTQPGPPASRFDTAGLRRAYAKTHEKGIRVSGGGALGAACERFLYSHERWGRTGQAELCRCGLLHPFGEIVPVGGSAFWTLGARVHLPPERVGG
jgi:hypothetical protein